MRRSAGPDRLLMFNLVFLMGCPRWQTDMMEAQLNNECVLTNALA